MRHASGAGWQSRPWGGCGRGFPPPAGGYGGPPPEKIENLHALRCIFRTKKVFLGRCTCTLYYNLEFFLNLTHYRYQEFLENYVYSYILQCLSHVTYYIRIKIDLFPSSVLH